MSYMITFILYMQTQHKRHMRLLATIYKANISLKNYKNMKTIHLNYIRLNTRLFIHSTNQKNMIYLEKHLKILKEQNICHIFK